MYHIPLTHYRIFHNIYVCTCEIMSTKTIGCPVCDWNKVHRRVKETINRDGGWHNWKGFRPIYICIRNYQQVQPPPPKNFSKPLSYINRMIGTLNQNEQLRQEKYDFIFKVGIFLILKFKQKEIDLRNTKDSKFMRFTCFLFLNLYLSFFFLNKKKLLL